ncbi:TIGR03943 family putative permease subunit [Treponema phagedenis]|uniref:TIGR03943 family putative permease subunit n=1 Tax=Treponema phagedenis TaxID=162 RepID=UPI0001F63C1F|nr:TIGR03943 family protein [Treponema phagedenis]EFW38064.1 TIGR03943 family protein [Treponema phagedenis F0421]TYT78433.1 TIGR03943 family protein [Treponema phagedenis]
MREIKMTKKNYFDIQEAGQILVLFILAITFLLTIFSGSVYAYVHKRHIPMIVFAACTFMLIAILKIAKLQNTTNCSHKKPWYLILFLLALAPSLLPSNKSLSISSLSFNMDTGTSLVQNHTTINPFTDNGTSAAQLTNGKIIMNDIDFGKWLPELYLRLDSWTGTEIEISGAVWLHDSFTETQFAIGRLLMVCCAADMQPVGILCESKTPLHLADDEWVLVSGIVEKSAYEEGFEPLIRVHSVKKIPRPAQEYVYPF